MTAIRICNHPPFFPSCKNIWLRMNIPIFAQRILQIRERLMGYNAHTMGVGNQCIARNARGLLVCLAEAAVDDDELRTGKAFLFRGSEFGKPTAQDFL